MAESKESDGEIGRRRLLAGGGLLATTALAGCSTIAELIVSQALQDVNVINSTEGRVRGTVTVTDPQGETVLNESFDLAPQKRSTDSTTTQNDLESQGVAQYDDVFNTSGPHTVAVSLSEETPIRGETSARREVPVPEGNQNVVVTLGSDEEPIAITTAQGTETPTDDG
ncbi:MAG: hypothetical protein ABEI99_00775 [Halobaculum sp.]